MMVLVRASLNDFVMLVQIFWQYIWTHIVLTDASNSNMRIVYTVQQRDFGLAATSNKICSF